MKTAFPSPSLTLLWCLPLLLGGCAHVAPGHDPLIVNAERSIEVSFEVVNAFVVAEHENRAAVARDMPDVHAYAESLRQNAPAAFAEAREALRLYKSSRQPSDGEAMNAKLSRVQSLARVARQYLLRIQTR